MLSRIFAALLALLSICATLIYAEEPTKIGAILPLSGPLASVGEAVKNGMIFADEAFDHDNKVQFVFEDDAYLPKNTVTAFRKLVDKDHVKAVFVFGSPPSLSVAHLAEKAKLPMISVAMTEALTKGKDFVVRYNVTAKSIDREVRTEVKKRGYQSIAIVSTENDAMLDSRELFLKESPAKVIYDQTFIPDQRDFRVSAAKIAELKPSAIFLLLMPPASSSFAKQVRALGYKGDIFGTPPLGVRQELEASDGALLGAWYISGNDRLAKGFYERYNKRHGEFPITEATYGHDIAKLLIEGAHAGDINSKLHSKDSFDGLLGRYGIDETNSFEVPTAVHLITEKGYILG
ncbi:MAG: ABC transporter substrate-binding protein [Deltaproteobacteria bacterium]|nr:ABC transporter substrate-binding protein [Deltaproteobacteria bacterium]